MPRRRSSSRLVAFGEGGAGIVDEEEQALRGEEEPAHRLAKWEEPTPVVVAEEVQSVHLGEDRGAGSFRRGQI